MMRRVATYSKIFILRAYPRKKIADFPSHSCLCSSHDFNSHGLKTAEYITVSSNSGKWQSQGGRRIARTT